MEYEYGVMAPVEVIIAVGTMFHPIIERLSLLSLPYFTNADDKAIIGVKSVQLIIQRSTRMGKRIIKEIISWILVLSAAFLLALFINKFIILNEEIPSGSMENTIMTGDRVFTYRQAYLFSDPKRGDIIVFPFPDDESVDYIKRIIGLPGETVEGKDGLVYIDGEPLEESYVKEEINEDFGPFEVPEDSYFMMGDNRNDSADSRYWNDPFVKKEKIKSKAIFKYPHFKWLK